MSLESPFTHQVEDVLRKAGWFPGRVVSPEQMAQWNELCPFFPEAERVMKEFGGLYIELSPTPPYYPRRETDCFCIDPVRAAYLEEEVVSIEPNHSYGCRIYPLGLRNYYPERVSGQLAAEAVLWLDEKGRVFFHTHFPVLVGTTFEIALHNLIIDSGLKQWNLKLDVEQYPPY